MAIASTIEFRSLRYSREREDEDVISDETAPLVVVTDPPTVSSTTTGYAEANVRDTQDAGELAPAGTTTALLNGSGKPTGQTAVTNASGSITLTGLGKQEASEASVFSGSLETPLELRRRSRRTQGPSTAGGNRLRRELAAYFFQIEQHLLERPDTLQDREVLELTLFNALGGRDTRPIARALLARYRTLGGVIASPPSELSAFRGLGKKGVAALKLERASAVNVLRKEVSTVPVMSTWDKLIDYLTVSLMHERVEHFHVLFLDGRGVLIADEIHGRGTINHAPVYPREIVRRCLELDASAIIMVHNHPSGDPVPSRQDVVVTEEVERAANIMGIALHDHVIVGWRGYWSFRREKLLRQSPERLTVGGH